MSNSALTSPLRSGRVACTRLLFYNLALVDRHLRRYVADEFQFRERLKFFERQTTDDQLGGLRIEHDLEAEPLELLEGCRRFIRQPDLKLRFAVTNEFRFIRSRLSVLILQAI